MNQSTQPTARIAVDIGGTFTDVVLELGDRSRITTKLLTTYDHPGTAVLAGITEVMTRGELVPSDIGLIIHGTTLATNALIERRGATTALLTTRGHRDALEMAHEDRFEQYDINIDRPAPLVPRHLRLTVDERMDYRGNVLRPLTAEDVIRHLKVLDDYEVESVAIGYLHAFVNPAHEHRTAELLQQHRPELSICLASEVAPEIREYERLSTACANAYVRPLMSRYLHRLADEIGALGFKCPFLLMTSGGGLTTLDTAAKFPIRLVESGPAGGAILATRIAEALDIDHLLSFDMGGTTAKLCLIDQKRPLNSRSFEVDRTYRFKKGSGLPVRIPVIEMVEIGAGGGSIANTDKLGRLQVGPESAGSEPGPAAYGHGGIRPTVTDADVQLGKVYPGTFAFDLDQTAATTALQTLAADHFDENVNFTAFSIGEVVSENMTAAARAHAAEFGLDLSGRDIVAFGGAAPLHAAALGQKLGANRIVIPRDAGVGSALGFLLAPVAYEVVRSRAEVLSDLNTAAINDIFQEMRSEATDVVTGAAPEETLIETRAAYMRYSGQGHELAVDLSNEMLNDHSAADLRSRFETSYGQLYGHTIEGVDIEVLSWTLTIQSRATFELPPVFGDMPPNAKPGSHESVHDTHAIYNASSNTKTDAPVFLRKDLAIDSRIIGPALITEAQTTTVVTKGYFASIDRLGNLILNREQPA